MKRIFTKSLTLALLSVVILSGCSKTTMKTRTELLTEYTWNQVYKGYDDDFDWNIDDYENYLYTCDKDNVWTFRKDYTLTEDEGAVRCGSAIGWTYDWHLSSDEKSITINSNTYIIKTLDAYTLEVYNDYPTADGMVRYIRKWSH